MNFNFFELYYQLFVYIVLYQEQDTFSLFFPFLFYFFSFCSEAPWQNFRPCSMGVRFVCFCFECVYVCQFKKWNGYGNVKAYVLL